MNSSEKLSQKLESLETINLSDAETEAISGGDHAMPVSGEVMSQHMTSGATEAGRGSGGSGGSGVSGSARPPSAPSPISAERSAALAAVRRILP
jgi:hypothetical protein